MSKTISILGATGSIGRQTLDVAEQLGLREIGRGTRLNSSH